MTEPKRTVKIKEAGNGSREPFPVLLALTAWSFAMNIFSPDGKLARCLNCIGSLIVLNILTLLCCIPVITIGPAITALYTMTMRIVRGEEGRIIPEYLRALKENFKNALLIWLFFGGLMAFMAFDIYLLQSLTGRFGLFYRALLFVLILFMAAVCMQAFALQARFTNTPKNTVKNAFILCAGRILPSLLMLAVSLSPLLLLTSSLRFISVCFLIGLSGPAYLAGIYFVSIFRVYETDDSSSEP